jgi:putative membrane protein
MKERVVAERFFSVGDQQKLKTCVEDVESRTSGEIAIVVVGRSSAYRECEVLGALFLGGLIALVLTELFFHSSVWAFIPLLFVLFFPAFHLFRKVPGLTVHLVSTRRKSEAVRERAMRVFYDKGLYKTRHHTGVLFFLSALERKVWVLADKGIYEKITHEALNSLARKVSRGMKEGRAVAALCEAIEACGVILTEYFPREADDRDELPDGVIFDKGP